MNTRGRAVLAVVLAGWLLAGCAGGGGAPTPTTAPSATKPTVVTRVPDGAPSADGTPIPGGTAVTLPPVQAAVQDLARKRSVDPATITVVSAESVEWRDSSLGCPEPGRAYAQVITPGYRVVLEVGGDRVTYHTDRQSKVVQCDQPAR